MTSHGSRYSQPISPTAAAAIQRHSLGLEKPKSPPLIHRVRSSSETKADDEAKAAKNHKSKSKNRRFRLNFKKVKNAFRKSSGSPSRSQRKSMYLDSESSSSSSGSSSEEEENLFTHSVSTLPGRRSQDQSPTHAAPGGPLHHHRRHHRGHEVVRKRSMSLTTERKCAKHFHHCHCHHRRSSHLPLLTHTRSSLKEEGITQRTHQLETLLTSTLCYDVMSISSKMIVLDVTLRVRTAFYALMLNSIRAAPLWNSETNQFVGMLTVSDFIHILCTYHQTDEMWKSHLDTMVEQRIITWRQVLGDYEKPFISVPATATLDEALDVLVTRSIHRLPVIDPETGNLLTLITHKRLLKFIYLSHFHKPIFYSVTVKALGIGTFGRENIVAIKMDTTIWDALNIFCDNELSGLPVEDNEGRCVGMFTRADVLRLVGDEKFKNLELPVSSCVSPKQVDELHTCKETDTLEEVITKCVVAEVYRLVVMDAKHRVKGIVALSDILFYLHTIQKDIKAERSIRDRQADKFTIMKPDITEEEEETDLEEKVKTQMEESVSKLRKLHITIPPSGPEIDVPSPTDFSLITHPKVSPAQPIQEVSSYL